MKLKKKENASPDSEIVNYPNYLCPDFFILKKWGIMHTVTI